MIAAGEFRHVITLQSRVMSEDEFGGSTYSWSDFATGVRAKFLPVKGREFVAGAAVQSEVTARFYIRHIDGLNASMRVVFDGQYYPLAAPPINMGGLGRVVELLVKAGASES